MKALEFGASHLGSELILRMVRLEVYMFDQKTTKVKASKCC